MITRKGFDCLLGFVRSGSVKSAERTLAPPSAPVEAKLLEPVFAFDREVIPGGTAALGKVVRTQPVRKWQRVSAILNGDFTPLRRARWSSQH
jgi:hypothetical protein